MPICYAIFLNLRSTKGGSMINEISKNEEKECKGTVVKWCGHINMWMKTILKQNMRL